MVCPALLPLMRTLRLPVVDWTDAPCQFKWIRPLSRKTKSGFCACAITFQKQSNFLPPVTQTWPSCKLVKQSYPFDSVCLLLCHPENRCCIRSGINVQLAMLTFERPCWYLTFSTRFMKLVSLFWTENHTLRSKHNFVQNKTEIMQLVLKMQYIS